MADDAAGKDQPQSRIRPTSAAGRAGSIEGSTAAGLAAAARALAGPATTESLHEIERMLQAQWRGYSDAAAEIERLEQDRPLSRCVEWWRSGGSESLAIAVAGPDAPRDLSSAWDGAVVRAVPVGRKGAPEARFDIDAGLGLWFGPADAAGRTFAVEFMQAPARAIRIDTAADGKPGVAAGPEPWLATATVPGGGMDDAAKALKLETAWPSVQALHRIQALAVVFDVIQMRVLALRREQQQDARIADERASQRMAKRRLDAEREALVDLLACRSELLDGYIDDCEEELAEHGLALAGKAREALSFLPTPGKDGERLKFEQFEREQAMRGGVRATPVGRIFFNLRTSLRFRRTDIEAAKAHVLGAMRGWRDERHRMARRRFLKRLEDLRPALEGISVDPARFMPPDDARTTDQSALGMFHSVDPIQATIEAYERDTLEAFVHVHERKGVFGVIQELRGMLFGTLFMGVFIAGLFGIQRSQVSQVLNLSVIAAQLGHWAAPLGVLAFLAPMAVFGLIAWLVFSERIVEQYTKFYDHMEQFHETAFKQLLSTLEKGMNEANDRLIKSMREQAGRLKDVIEAHKLAIDEQLSDASRSGGQAMKPETSSGAARSGEPMPGNIQAPAKDAGLLARQRELEASIRKMLTG